MNYCNPKGSEVTKETYLNVVGYDDRKFTDRAISYATTAASSIKGGRCATLARTWGGATGSAGAMFTLDTEKGFRDVVFGASAYGLGETVKTGGPALSVTQVTSTGVNL